MDEHHIYENALALRGDGAQEDMMMEEASELIKAILKHRRGKITDVDVLDKVEVDKPRYYKKVFQEEKRSLFFK